MKDGLKLRQRWGQGKLITNHQQLPQEAKRPVFKVQKKIVSHFIGVSRVSFNLARGASIKPVAFGQWKSRNYFSFFSRPFLDILWWLLLVLSRGESIAREHTTPLLKARDTENKYGGARLFLCKFKYFCARLLLACLIWNSGLSNSIYTVKS